MIQNTSFIRIDPHGRELAEGYPLFPLVANEGDVHQYIASCIPSHWHRDIEVFVLLEGQVRVEAGNAAYIIHNGEGCFINSGVLHSFTGLVDTPCHYRSFVFDPGIVAGAPGSVFDTLYVRPLTEQGPAFLSYQKEFLPAFFEWFDHAFTACIEEAPAYEFRVRAALSELLTLIQQSSQILPPRQWTTIQEVRLKQMLRWIDEHKDDSLSLKDIALAANICPRECQRIFRQYLHCRPMEYLQKRRIFAAAEDLATTDEPVTSIALTHGFSSPSYFSKKFRQLVGHTPSTYRKAAQRAADCPNPYPS